MTDCTTRNRLFERLACWAVLWACAAPAAADVLTVCGGSGQLFGENAPASENMLVEGAGDVTVTFVSVDVLIEHSWVGDLRAILTHAQRSVDLFDRPGYPSTVYGCGGDDIEATLRDDAGPSVEEACSLTPPAIGGTFRSAGLLSDFIGLNPGNIWNLTILDFGADDCGVLPEGGVCVHITFEPDCNQNGVPDDGDIGGGGSTDYNENGVPDECENLCDFDGDGDVDAEDYDRFAVCAAESNEGPYGEGCAVFDIDGDEDVDLTDFRFFQILFTGS